MNPNLKIIVCQNCGLMKIFEQMPTTCPKCKSTDLKDSLTKDSPRVQDSTLMYVAIQAIVPLLIKDLETETELECRACKERFSDPYVMLHELDLHKDTCRFRHLALVAKHLVARQ